LLFETQFDFDILLHIFESVCDYSVNTKWHLFYE
jgi:hypothetical protein